MTSRWAGGSAMSVRERDAAAESDAIWDFEVTARFRSDATVLGALDRLRLRLMTDYEVPVVLEPGGVGCVAVRAELRAGSDGYLRWQVGSQRDDAKRPTHGRGKTPLDAMYGVVGFLETNLKRAEAEVRAYTEARAQLLQMQGATYAFPE